MGGHKISPKNQGGHSSQGQGNKKHTQAATNKASTATTTALPAPNAKTTTTIASATGKAVVSPTNNKTTAATNAAATTAAATNAAAAANDNRAQAAMATQRMKEMLSEVQDSKINTSGKAVEKKAGQTAAGAGTATAAATTKTSTATTNAKTTAAVAAEVTTVVPMSPPPTTGPKPFHCLNRAWFPYTTDDGYEYFLTTSVEGVVHSQWEDPRTHGFVEEQEDEEDD